MGTGTKTKHHGHQEELMRKYSCKLKINFDLYFFTRITLYFIVHGKK